MKEKVKFGVFGTWRGLSYIKALKNIEEAEIVAICDKDPEKIEKAKEFCPPDVKVCKDFDELLSSGIDAVVLCNYFHQHAPFAIKAAKAGIHIFSETQAAVTMKECVELVEAVEENGVIYALAENYPFFRANQEMEKIYQSGQIGEVIFAEGEYVHPMSVEEHHYFNPDPTHWRSLTPCTFYCTHAMAPLMKITGLNPVKVIGKVAANREYARERGMQSADNYGVLLCEMENGSVFRVGGCGSFGGHGNWYRLGCSKGGVESLRGDVGKVRLCVNPWELKDENRQFGTEAVYSPELTETDKKAQSSGHDGGDYWVTWTFVQDVLNKHEPFMNVYRSASLAAMGILGWQSAVDNSKQMVIPDFRKKEDRDAVRNNDLTPFSMYGQEATLPAALYTQAT